MGPWITQSVPWLYQLLEMPGHVALSTAVASGFCLVQRVQAGYRTLCWSPLTCLFIVYGVSYHADKTAVAWSSPHIPIPPRIRIVCSIPLLSIYRHGLYIHHITPVYFTTVISLATVCTCSGIIDDKMQPVYSDTFYVPLTHTAISHFKVEPIFSVNVL